VSHRFFVEDEPGEDAVIQGDQARQIATVLRLAPGERVILIAGGREHEVALAAVGVGRVTGRVVARRSVTTEPPFALTLAVPLLKGDRSEEIIEAASQLGVTRFVPFVSARSVVRDLSAPKLDRWRRIAREAAETARRGQSPEVDPAVSLAALPDRLDGTLLVCWEEAAEPQLGELHIAQACSVVVGPEGGLSAAEAGALVSRGARTVSLGPRTLRAETAAIAAVALVVSGMKGRPPADS